MTGLSPGDPEYRIRHEKKGGDTMTRIVLLGAILITCLLSFAAPSVQAATTPDYSLVYYYFDG